uniref:CG14294-PA n=1 Tax=Drosophila erecta TaxID=7220 RepID=Q8I1I5_DROER|nr:CG14294-PA [Drosophila erecta]
MNYNEPDRIQKAAKAAKKAETKIYDFYVRKLENQKKVAAREILDNAYFETVYCIKTFYEGGMELQFNDCMQHVIDLHIGRLKSLLQITTERYSSGASRLNIWHW